MAIYDLASVTAPTAVSLAVGDIIECSYCGAQKTATLPAGFFKLECWGAQGGASQYSTSNTLQGGKGGYVSGYLTLSAATTVYLSAGGQGSAVTTANTNQGAGWNGGGTARSSSIANYKPAGGGGGSDIRIGGTGLNNRIIVAGGGGGAFNYGNTSTESAYGGYGGGSVGGAPTSTQYSGYLPTGGGLTAVGLCYMSGGTNVAINTSYYNPINSFGTAGTQTANMNYTAGGGGGWYPGGSSQYESSAGGSSYVYTSATASNYPGTKPSTSYYLLSPQNIAGNASMPSVNGDSETGHSGNGFVRITFLGTSFYDITSGTSPASTSITSGTIIFCSYSGATRNISLPIGEYKLECWGAQGGACNNASAENMEGGKGGYATGILTLMATTTLYLSAGGAGINPTSTGLVTGGWNGGGAGCCTNTGVNYRKGSGGGASDIRVAGSTLNDRIIVAGGGGGASVANVTYKPGSGGGSSGGNGVTWGSIGGTGGSQTSKGISYYNSTAGQTSYLTEADFGTGGGAKTSSYCCTGGGGGWYGGGASLYTSNYQCGSAGGGSGYVYTSSTAASYPSPKPNNQYYLSNTSMSNEIQSKNGQIMITAIRVYEIVNIPTLSNKTYNATAQSPTETNYNSTAMVKSGDTSATMPGTYTIVYTLNEGYMWSDYTLDPKSVTWEITSNWKTVQSWVYDSTL